MTEPQELVEIDDEDPRLEEVNQSCDVIRRKINNLINSGEMKVGAFQEAIGVSAKSYSGFMSKSGRYAGDNVRRHIPLTSTSLDHLTLD